MRSPGCHKERLTEYKELVVPENYEVLVSNRRTMKEPMQIAQKCMNETDDQGNSVMKLKKRSVDSDCR